MQWNPAQTLVKIPAPSSDKNEISQKRDQIGDQLNDIVVSVVVDKRVESVGQAELKGSVITLNVMRCK